MRAFFVFASFVCRLPFSAAGAFFVDGPHTTATQTSPDRPHARAHAHIARPLARTRAPSSQLAPDCVPPVSGVDIERAFHATRATVARADVTKFERWNADFGAS